MHYVKTKRQSLEWFLVKRCLGVTMFFHSKASLEVCLDKNDFVTYVYCHLQQCLLMLLSSVSFILCPIAIIFALLLQINSEKN